MSNMSKLAYSKVLEAARETGSSIGLDALLVVLGKFDGPGGMNGVSQADHNYAVAKVKELHAEALKAEKQLSHQAEN